LAKETSLGNILFSISTIFEAWTLESANLSGKVFSGKGEGAKFVGLDWVKKQIQEKLGFEPYLGTLNIRLSGESIVLREQTKKRIVSQIYPQIGYCTGLISQASIGNVKSAIVIPLVKDYPDDVLEVIAPLNLRELLKIHDGDVITVSIVI